MTRHGMAGPTHMVVVCVCLAVDNVRTVLFLDNDVPPPIAWKTIAVICDASAGTGKFDEARVALERGCHEVLCQARQRPHP